ncbi:MAG: GNAT family N-acetyltransferase [Rhizobiaceae bacterium]|nr:GNAT family N-acetyltransferase [Rhizobiaceae bacterium]MCV0408546.1 GNAT family N-acetyltransferase [Rhizobiaceae bacterium]
MLTLSMRASGKGDARFLLHLEEQCVRGYAVALWGSWRPSSTVEAFDPAGHRVLMQGGVDIGCVATEERADHIWIQKLYVHPDWQNLGVGTWALRHVVNEAVSARLPVRLSVLVTNPAVGFYEREGFSVSERSAERIRMVRWPQA